MSSKRVGDFPVSGKIVVITGGGSGIGLAFAKLAHSNSARILIGDLKLLPEAQEFVDSAKDQIFFTKCNVTKWSDLKNLISVSVEHFGSVPDVYVPCAGIFDPPWSNFWDDNEDEKGSYATLRINTDHPVKMTRLAMKALLGAGKKGVVCLIASTAGLGGNYIASLYCASKWAIVGFARSMEPAEEHEGVKVVAICPGIVISPLWTDRTDDRAKVFDIGHVPALTPKDIAGTMLKLVEDGKHQGGTVMMHTPTDGEVVIHEGGGKGMTVTSTASSELGPVKGVLDKERNVAWTG